MFVPTLPLATTPATEKIFNVGLTAELPKASVSPFAEMTGEMSGGGQQRFFDSSKKPNLIWGHLEGKTIRRLRVQ